MILRTAIFVLVGLMLACCGRRHDPRLDRAAVLAAVHPDSARALLDSIAPGSLSEADRHYRDLLSIRAADKAYITHVSDSLILDVIDYYAGHRSAPDHYPMALYYGGRVYDDLGDYPTAMQYFQDAIDLLPPDTDDQDLRSSALSQYGRMLNYLRLYDEALTIVESAIDAEEMMGDTASLIYDLQLLASIQQRSENHGLAEKSLMRALDLCNGKPYHYTAETLNALADVKIKTGHVDEAVALIRGVPNKVEPGARSGALSDAALIYYKAGIYDTARIYSLELLGCDDHSAQTTAYQILLAPEMLNQLSVDTMSQYLWNYRKLLERFFNQNQTQYALMRQNAYNYQIHQAKEAKIRHRNQTLKQCVLAAVLGILVLASLILYQRTKMQTKIIELQHALTIVDMLEERLDAQAAAQKPTLADPPPQSQQQSESQATSGHADAAAAELITNDDEHKPSLQAKHDRLREKLKAKLLKLYASVDENAPMSELIIKSRAYSLLLDCIGENKTIDVDDPIWKELEMAILESSPDFKTNLQILTMGNLTKSEYRIALMIKCGFKPTQMMTLMGRTNGAINSRRRILSQKVLDQTTSTRVIDAIIRLM